MRLKFPFLRKELREPGKMGWEPPKILLYKDSEGRNRKVVYQNRANTKGLAPSTLVPGYLVEKKEDYWVVEPIEKGEDMNRLEEILGERSFLDTRFWNPKSFLKENPDYILEK